MTVGPADRDAAGHTRRPTDRRVVLAEQHLVDAVSGGRTGATFHVPASGARAPVAVLPSVAAVPGVVVGAAVEISSLGGGSDSMKWM